MSSTADVQMSDTKEAKVSQIGSIGFGRVRQELEQNPIKFQADMLDAIGIIAGSEFESDSIGSMWRADSRKRWVQMVEFQSWMTALLRGSTGELEEQQSVRGLLAKIFRLPPDQRRTADVATVLEYRARNERLRDWKRGIEDRIIDQLQTRTLSDVTKQPDKLLSTDNVSVEEIATITMSLAKIAQERSDSKDPFDSILWESLELVLVLPTKEQEEWLVRDEYTSLLRSRAKEFDNGVMQITGTPVANRPFAFPNVVEIGIGILNQLDGSLVDRKLVTDFRSLLFQVCFGLPMVAHTRIKYTSIAQLAFFWVYRDKLTADIVCRLRPLAWFNRDLPRDVQAWLYHRGNGPVLSAEIALAVRAAEPWKRIMPEGKGVPLVYEYMNRYPSLIGRSFRYVASIPNMAHFIVACDRAGALQSIAEPSRAELEVKGEIEMSTDEQKALEDEWKVAARAAVEAKSQPGSSRLKQFATQLAEMDKQLGGVLPDNIRKALEGEWKFVARAAMQEGKSLPGGYLFVKRLTGIDERLSGSLPEWTVITSLVTSCLMFATTLPLVIDGEDGIRALQKLTYTVGRKTLTVRNMGELPSSAEATAYTLARQDADELVQELLRLGPIQDMTGLVSFEWEQELTLRPDTVGAFFQRVGLWVPAVRAFGGSESQTRPKSTLGQMKRFILELGFAKRRWSDPLFSTQEEQAVGFLRRMAADQKERPVLNVLSVKCGTGLPFLRTVCQLFSATLEEFRLGCTLPLEDMMGPLLEAKFERLKELELFSYKEHAPRKSRLAFVAQLVLNSLATGGKLRKVVWIATGDDRLRLANEEGHVWEVDYEKKTSFEQVFHELVQPITAAVRRDNGERELSLRKEDADIGLEYKRLRDLEQDAKRQGGNAMDKIQTALNALDERAKEVNTAMVSVTGASVWDFNMPLALGGPRAVADVLDSLADLQKQGWWVTSKVLLDVEYAAADAPLPLAADTLGRLRHANRQLMDQLPSKTNEDPPFLDATDNLKFVLDKITINGMTLRIHQQIQERLIAVPIFDFDPPNLFIEFQPRYVATLMTWFNASLDLFQSCHFHARYRDALVALCKQDKPLVNLTSVDTPPPAKFNEWRFNPNLEDVKRPDLVAVLSSANLFYLLANARNCSSITLMSVWWLDANTAETRFVRYAAEHLTDQAVGRLADFFRYVSKLFPSYVDVHPFDVDDEGNNHPVPKSLVPEAREVKERAKLVEGIESLKTFFDGDQAPFEPLLQLLSHGLDSSDKQHLRQLFEVEDKLAWVWNSDNRMIRWKDGSRGRAYQYSLALDDVLAHRHHKQTTSELRVLDSDSKADATADVEMKGEQSKSSSSRSSSSSTAVYMTDIPTEETKEGKEGKEIKTREVKTREMKTKERKGAEASATGTTSTSSSSSAISLAMSLEGELGTSETKGTPTSIRGILMPNLTTLRLNFGNLFVGGETVLRLVLSCPTLENLELLSLWNKEWEPDKALVNNQTLRTMFAFWNASKRYPIKQVSLVLWPTDVESEYKKVADEVGYPRPPATIEQFRWTTKSATFSFEEQTYMNEGSQREAITEATSGEETPGLVPFLGEDRVLHHRMSFGPEHNVEIPAFNVYEYNRATGDAAFKRVKDRFMCRTFDWPPSVVARAPDNLPTGFMDLVNKQAYFVNELAIVTENTPRLVEKLPQDKPFIVLYAENEGWRDNTVFVVRRADRTIRAFYDHFDGRTHVIKFPWTETGFSNALQARLEEWLSARYDLDGSDFKERPRSQTDFKWWGRGKPKADPYERREPSPFMQHFIIMAVLNPTLSTAEILSFVCRAGIDYAAFPNLFQLGTDENTRQTAVLLKKLEKSRSSSSSAEIAHEGGEGGEEGEEGEEGKEGKEGEEGEEGKEGKEEKKERKKKKEGKEEKKGRRVKGKKHPERKKKTGGRLSAFDPSETDAESTPLIFHRTVELQRKQADPKRQLTKAPPPPKWAQALASQFIKTGAADRLVEHQFRKEPQPKPTELQRKLDSGSLVRFEGDDSSSTAAAALQPNSIQFKAIPNSTAVDVRVEFPHQPTTDQEERELENALDEVVGVLRGATQS